MTSLEKARKVSPLQLNQNHCIIQAKKAKHHVGGMYNWRLNQVVVVVAGGFEVEFYFGGIEWIRNKKKHIRNPTRQ